MLLLQSKPISMSANKPKKAKKLRLNIPFEKAIKIIVEKPKKSK